MPSLVTDPGNGFQDFPAQVVEVVDYFDAPGGFVVVPHLYCDKLTRAVNAIDTAELTYEIGEGVIQPADFPKAYRDYQPLNLKGKFVRVTIFSQPNIVWIGYVVNDEVLRHGVQGDGTNKLAGKQQVFDAVGLEWFLDRKQITSAVVREKPGDDASVRIERALVFNGGPMGALDSHSALRANRSEDTNEDGKFDFAQNLEQAELWSAVDILDHLMQYQLPQTSAGNNAPCDFLVHVADLPLLSGFYPSVDAENRTVFDVLNDVVRPQRGLVWWTEFSETGGTHVDIRIASLAGSPISLPGGGTLPANGNQQSLDFDGEVDVELVRLRQLGFRDYHQMIARGARMTATMTVGMPDDTFALDWSQAGANEQGSEAKYKQGGSTETGYAVLSDDDKKKFNDAVRLAHEFHRVYQAYRIPANWDGKTGDGATATKAPAFARLTSTGSVTETLPVQPQGVRLLNRLRLKRGWDYSNPADPKPSSPAASIAQLSPPFVFVKVTTGSSSEVRYQCVDKLTHPKFGSGLPVSPDIGTTFNVMMQESVPGILLDAHNGMPHALALGHWSGAAAGEQEPEVDYETLRATVCAEADHYCEGKYPADVDLPENKPLNVLEIYAGENFRLDFLAGNTVVALKRGVPQTCGAGGTVLRDDRKYLEDLARMAFEWYQLDRHSLSVLFRQVRPLFELGMLITVIGEGSTLKNINTIVSTIVYDLKAGTLEVSTDDDTLDVRSLV